MMVSWPNIIHILPGYTKCNCYQRSFWLILFLGWSIQPAEPSQEAEDSAQRVGQQRLLLHLPDILKLHLAPGVKPDHDDQHSASGSKEPPSPNIYWPLTMGPL